MFNDPPNFGVPFNPDGCADLQSAQVRWHSFHSTPYNLRSVQIGRNGQLELTEAVVEEIKLVW